MLTNSSSVSLYANLLGMWERSLSYFLTTVVKWLRMNKLKWNAHRTEVKLVGKLEVLKDIMLPTFDGVQLNPADWAELVTHPSKFIETDGVRSWKQHKSMGLEGCSLVKVAMLQAEKLVQPPPCVYQHCFVSDVPAGLNPLMLLTPALYHPSLVFSSHLLPSQVPWNHTCVFRTSTAPHSTKPIHIFLWLPPPDQR